MFLYAPVTCASCRSQRYKIYTSFCLLPSLCWPQLAPYTESFQLYVKLSCLCGVVLKLCILVCNFDKLLVVIWYDIYPWLCWWGWTKVCSKCTSLVDGCNSMMAGALSSFSCEWTELLSLMWYLWHTSVCSCSLCQLQVTKVQDLHLLLSLPLFLLTATGFIYWPSFQLHVNCHIFGSWFKAMHFCIVVFIPLEWDIFLQTKVLEKLHFCS